MARNNYRGTTTPRRAPKDMGRRVKKKPCAMCREGVEWVDYKDIPTLRKYMSDRGKIRSRRVTGNCAQHQRAIAQAIKVARELVLLPYTQRTVTERPGGRGGREDRGERGERSGRPTGPGAGGRERDAFMPSGEGAGATAEAGAALGSDLELDVDSELEVEIAVEPAPQGGSGASGDAGGASEATAAGNETDAGRLPGGGS
jgi:small subunit ribosomal protein S18